MARGEKLLQKMKNNPRDWRIEDIKSVAKKYGIEWRQQGTRHVTFRHPSMGSLVIPPKRPIKPVYADKFVKWIEEIKK